MKLTTLTLAALALTLDSSTALAGPQAGKADAKAGAGSTHQLNGSLAQGEEAKFELDASAGSVRLKILAEAGMSVLITDLKGGQSKRAVIAGDGPRVIDLPIVQPTRLQVRIKPLEVRRPAGPFLHMPARAEREDGFSLSIANVKSGKSKSMGVRNKYTGLSGPIADGDPRADQGSQAGQGGSPKGGAKKSAS